MSIFLCVWIFVSQIFIFLCNTFLVLSNLHWCWWKTQRKGTRNSTRTKDNKMFFALRPNYTEANIASYFICGNFQLRGNIQVTLLARRNRERERCYLKYKWSHVPLVQGYLMKLHYYSQGSIIQKLCPNG